MVSVSPNHQHYHQQNTSVIPPSKMNDMEGSFTTTTATTTTSSTESPLELEYKQLKRKMKEITEVILPTSTRYLELAATYRCFI